MHLPDDQPSPELRIVLFLRLTLHQLWADNVAHAVCHEYGCRHETLLGVPSHVAHADRDDQTNDASKCADDGVSGDGSSCVIRPVALPDHGTAGNDRETADDEHDDADIRDPRAEETGEENDDQAETSQGELEEDAG